MVISIIIINSFIYTRFRWPPDFLLKKRGISLRKGKLAGPTKSSYYPHGKTYVQAWITKNHLVAAKWGFSLFSTENHLVVSYGIETTWWPLSRFFFRLKT